MSEKVNDLRTADLFPINQLVSFVQETAEVHMLKCPSSTDVARSHLAILAERAMGKPKVGKCVDPRLDWLRILGHAFPGATTISEVGGPRSFVRWRDPRSPVGFWLWPTHPRLPASCPPRWGTHRGG